MSYSVIDGLVGISNVAVHSAILALALEHTDRQTDRRTD